MKNFREVYLNKKGYSLLELILGICITSMLLMCFYSILHYTINVSKLSDKRDDILLNGRYALLYIKDEIRSSDKVIDISKFKDLDKTYPENIGFVILKKSIKFATINKKLVPIENYNYITYYLKDESLMRLACNREDPKYPSKSFFGGHNELCRGLNSLEKFNYNVEKNILIINFRFNNGIKDIDFKSNIFLNCPVDLFDGGEYE